MARPEPDSVDGIFNHLLDQAAFIDRIEMGVWGQRRVRTTDMIRVDRQLPILGKKRMYARAMHGTCLQTGNRFHLKYGKLSHFKSVPPYRLILHANQTPITCAQVFLTASQLFWARALLSISQLELTLDVTGTSVQLFRRHLVGKAKQTRTLRDQQNRYTFYVGRPTSAWQVIVYVKTQIVTRFEFKIRRAALRRFGIRKPHEVALLRTANLFGDWVSLREIDGSALPELQDHLSDGDLSRARIVRKWADELSSRQFMRLTKTIGLWRPGWLRECEMQAKLLAMQRRLIW